MSKGHYISIAMTRCRFNLSGAGFWIILFFEVLLDTIVNVPLSMPIRLSSWTREYQFEAYKQVLIIIIDDEQIKWIKKEREKSAATATAFII